MYVCGFANIAGDIHSAISKPIFFSQLYSHLGAVEDSMDYLIDHSPKKCYQPKWLDFIGHLMLMLAYHPFHSIPNYILVCTLSVYVHIVSIIEFVWLPIQYFCFALIESISTPLRSSDVSSHIFFFLHFVWGIPRYRLEPFKTIEVTKQCL